jgi:hypothetical protein
MNGCVPGLALIKRLRATRKWAINGSSADSPKHSPFVQVAPTDRTRLCVLDSIGETSLHISFGAK